MLREHYKIETDVARVYKVRGRVRFGWGWAVATIREWPRGGQIDVQSDFGSFAFTWTAVGNRSLREFLCGLNFDYFMNKTRGNYRVFDGEASVRAVKADIFDLVDQGEIDRETAHEWRDDVDELSGCFNAHEFSQRLAEFDWCYRIYDILGSTIKERDCPNCRAFWDGPWQALCAYWRAEIAAERQKEAA